MIKSSHPLTATTCQLTSTALDTLNDPSESLKTRRFALLLMQAVDGALLQYGDVFDVAAVEAELHAFTSRVSEDTEPVAG